MDGWVDEFVGSAHDKFQIPLLAFRYVNFFVPHVTQALHDVIFASMTATWNHMSFPPLFPPVISLQIAHYTWTGRRHTKGYIHVLK